MGQRILDGLEKTFVELGFLALGDKAHLAVQSVGKIPDDAGKLRENVGHRLHACLHDRFAKVGGNHIEAAGKQRQIGVMGGRLEDLVAGENELANEVHHAIEEDDIDPQRGVCGVGSARAGSFRSGVEGGLEGGVES